MPRIAYTITQRLDTLGLLVMIGLCWSLAFPYFESVRNANERPRILQAMALVDEGSFAIDGPARRGLEAGPDVARSPVNQRLYPNKPPGTSLVGAVAYVAARGQSSWQGESLSLRALTWWCRLFAGLLPALVIAGYVARRQSLSLGAPAVSFAVMTWAFATPVASYMRLFYGHLLAAALIFVGSSICLNARHLWFRAPIGTDRNRSQTLKSGARAMLVAAGGGALCGCAIGVEYLSAFLGLPLAVILLSRWRQSGALQIAAAGFVGALVPVAALAIYHAQVFGSALSTGYHHVTNAEFASKHGEGLLGLGWPSWEAVQIHLLSPGAGLLWWAPLVIFALYGLFQLALVDGEWRDEARMAMASFLLILALGLCLSFDGGWRVGPRYLIVATPFLILGWGHSFAQFRSERWLVGLVGIFLTYSIIVNTWAAAMWPHFDLTNCNSPVVEVLMPLIRYQHAPYGWGFSWGMEPEFELWLLFGLPIVCTGLTFARNVFFGIRMTIVLIAALLLGYGAVKVLPYLHTAHPRGEANLNYIRRVYEPALDSSGKHRRPGSSRTIVQVQQTALARQPASRSKGTEEAP